jgi:glycosyltransferase involved in cell wall biosynthesis
MKTTGQRIALFMATSGHSGVDRVIHNLVREFGNLNIPTDVLHIRNHGPYFGDVPPTARIVELGTSHVASSLLSLCRYLQIERPRAILTDKDRVNRVALLARHMTKVSTRVVIRIGTTVSKNLERRAFLARKIQMASMRCFYSWADALIVPSRGAREDVAQIARLPQGRIHVIPSPVVSPVLSRLASEPVNHPWFRPGSPPVILGVGELCARKDFATLIRAFAKVREHRCCRLVILGEGRKRSALMDLSLKLGVGNDVLLPGFVKNPYAYMGKAALFVLSSNCEGAPIVLLEAMAVGAPVVTTDCPSGPREILDDGRFGPLVPVGDSARMAEAMIDVLDHPLNAAALKAAVRPYDTALSARNYLSALSFDFDFSNGM